MKPLVTIWDIDKTLYDGYAIIDFGMYLEEIGKFRVGFKEQILESKRSYEKGKTSYENFANSVYEIYGEYIDNLNMYEILQLSKGFWQRSISKLYPAARSLYDFLTVKNSEHAAISGSSFESLYYLADRLKFVKIKTTEYETIDGNFTKKIVSTLVSHGDKSKLEDRVLNQKNKYKVTVGVGDNYADCSFLKLVDIPIVMGTRDQILADMANSEGWFVIQDPNSILSKEMRFDLEAKLKTVTEKS